MKNILIFILLIFSLNSVAISKETTFTDEVFQKSQLDGKTVVIHSWNKTCVTCAEQVEILKQAEQDFKDVIFLSFEQTKDKKIAKFLEIDYWTTIVIYKDNKELSRTIGQTDKDKIYSQIKSLK
ncbi:thioredoxin family protein [Candidatus Pelagibacter sp.]|jgi:thiol-disulfide isomerase/thioredoxin|nr:thioredoxin family protein [Candidatus Pelagibacter sp.]MDB3886524.1 thioredoxin family protein [Candidatus Pelagibacter sp.]MDC0420019.1 thioredoxin family protein [Candidatus Pelagibacter sp.]MDC0895618.1 thioredoxin family protein [Candidatus Pelagibacter sp.]MDC0900817.1 thioredoxin family protein [Candidatus Pelagibacter sp.]|tara:strand:+ start:325 stop:696 length:372 start_codon:yes stop_codon:yes gene_type:complete